MDYDYGERESKFSEGERRAERSRGGESAIVSAGKVRSMGHGEKERRRTNSTSRNTPCRVIPVSRADFRRVELSCAAEDKCNFQAYRSLNCLYKIVHVRSMIQTDFIYFSRSNPGQASSSE